MLHMSMLQQETEKRREKRVNLNIFARIFA
nr:MAG TPA: hypothetical protein [Caudoviricetes sp.]